MTDDLTVRGDLRIGPPEPMPVVIYDENHELMVTVHRDHTVTLHQPDRVNEAAQIFWRAVQGYGVAHCVAEHAPDACRCDAQPPAPVSARPNATIMEWQRSDGTTIGGLYTDEDGNPTHTPPSV